MAKRTTPASIKKTIRKQTLQTLLDLLGEPGEQGDVDFLADLETQIVDVSEIDWDAVPEGGEDQVTDALSDGFSEAIDEVAQAIKNLLKK